MSKFEKPMTKETRCCEVFFPNYSKQKSAEDTLVPQIWGKRGEKNVFLNITCSRGCMRRNLCAFTLKVVNTLIKSSSRDDRWAFDLDVESTHGQPASCRARPVNVDDAIEDIKWIRGLGGGKLPTAS